MRLSFSLCKTPERMLNIGHNKVSRGIEQFQPNTLQLNCTDEYSAQWWFYSCLYLRVCLLLFLNRIVATYSVVVAAVARYITLNNKKKKKTLLNGEITVPSGTRLKAFDWKHFSANSQHSKMCVWRGKESKKTIYVHRDIGR